MNKYHRHKSRGINTKSRRTISRLRCPITFKLLDRSNSKLIVFWGERPTVIGATRSGISMWVHVEAQV